MPPETRQLPTTTADSAVIFGTTTFKGKAFG